MTQGDLTGRSAALPAAGPAARADARRLPLSHPSGSPALATVLLTLAAFSVAEGITVFTDPVTGVALHAATLSALLLVSGAGARAGAQQPLGRLLYALALVPLIRIVSLAMPLGRFEQEYWFLAAGLPVFVGGGVVLSHLGIRLGDVGVRLPRSGPLPELLIVLFGFALGFGEYRILRPEPLIEELTLRQFVVPALILLVFTGVLEEFVFRGILQRTAAQALGSSTLAIVYVSLIFAVLHIGYRSVSDFAFVFAIALLYGWVVRKTGSIIGVSVSHGITNITLFLLMPFSPVLTSQPHWLSPLV
jgi:membrane protease YdiL (CAAX protease family)